MARRRAKSKRGSGGRSRLFLRLLIICALGWLVFNHHSISISSLFAARVPMSYAVDDRVGLPAIADSTYFIVNSVGRYSYMYSPKERQSEWVAYCLTRADVTGKKVKRSDRFVPDSQVVARGWDSATTDDYYKSSFDRGHLLPSADRNSTRAENQETFNLSNISPQKSTLNRNVWADLEGQVRKWAEQYDTLYIVTGGVLEDKHLGYIGKGRVTVPDRFFKVVLSVRGGRYNAIGFVMPNSTKLKDDYMSYSMSINRIERITGYDFFHHLPDEIERRVERKSNTLFWTKSFTPSEFF